MKSANERSHPSKSPSELIDERIASGDDWRARTLGFLREVIRTADPAIVEDLKWKKPSNPGGVPVWSHDGIICIGDTLKESVRLTFAKGAQLKDPARLFNSRMDSKTVRAIDVHEGELPSAAALSALVREAGRLNAPKTR